MNEVLKEFSEIINEIKILQERKDQRISESKIKIRFIDNSLLEATEIEVFSIKKRKYAYQWMNAKFELITRWDNANHHKHISTYPHHKHIGAENNIVESIDITLNDVLIEIRESIKNT